MGDTLALKTQDTVTTKEYRYSEAGCLIPLCYFNKIYPSIISNLVRYWAVNNIMAVLYSIQSGINLQWIPKFKIS